MPRKAKPKPLYIEKSLPTVDTATTRPATDWRDPDAKFDDDDQSLQARMWRLYQHQRKGFGT